MGTIFFRFGARRFCSDFQFQIGNKSKPGNRKQIEAEYENKSFAWMRSGGHDGPEPDFKALHFQWQKAIVLYVTFVISKLSTWGGTPAESSPAHEAGGCPGGGRPEPSTKKNRNAQYEQKSFDKSFRTISKSALPQIGKNRSERFPEPLRIIIMIYA